MKNIKHSDVSDTALLDIIARLENYIEHKVKKNNYKFCFIKDF